MKMVWNRLGSAGIGVMMLSSMGLLGSGATAQAASFPAGTLVRVAHHAKVYVYEQGAWHWIPNAQTFNAMGLSWSHVTTVPSQSVLGLPGFPVTLVRQANSSQVFLEQGGKLHWIFSAPVFHALGYHWSEVFAVKVLPLPLGLPITGASYPEFAPVVRGTLQWLASKNAPEAGAPAWIPPLPDARQADFISATASVSAQGWGVELHETRHPYGINYPSINASPHTHPFVGWGMNHMIPGQMGSAETAAGRLSLLESYSNLGPTHPPVTTAVSRRVNLGEGIMGQLYSNHTVLWHEGLWTMMVQGNSGAHDVAEAKPLVSYLHQNALPPYPGLIAVLQDTASADWLQGTSLYGIEGGQEPALSVLHMATSFQNVP